MMKVLSHKQERNFATIRSTLEAQNVDTAEAAEACRQNMLTNAKTYCMFVVLVGVSLAVLLATVAVPILVGTGIIVLFIVTSTYRARQLVSRYIDEVLKKSTEPPVDEV